MLCYCLVVGLEYVYICSDLLSTLWFIVKSYLLYCTKERKILFLLLTQVRCLLQHLGTQVPDRQIHVLLACSGVCWFGQLRQIHINSLLISRSLLKTESEKLLINNPDGVAYGIIQFVLETSYLVPY